MLDLLIVGGGPAGLTAALYAARAGLSALVLEKALPGGQVTQASLVENYPGFAQGVDAVDLCMAMEGQATRAGAQIRYEAAEEIDCAGHRVRTASGWLEGRALILALGASPRHLGIPGEKELTGRGVSYCATCDGAFYKGKPVAVLGGGNSAAEEALYLAGLGCSVQLIHRRDRLRAEAAVAEKVLRHPGITPVLGATASAFDGKERLEAVALADGHSLSVAAAFVSIGREPDTALVRGQVALDETGYLLAGEDCRTGLPLVYAAGDARAKALRQIITAASDGAISAADAARQIEGR